MWYVTVNKGNRDSFEKSDVIEKRMKIRWEEKTNLKSTNWKNAKLNGWLIVVQLVN